VVTKAERARPDRLAAGAAIRTTVPRGAHADVPAGPRPDPISILEDQARTRIAALIPIRYARMRASPLAFLRGAAAIMASDLAHTPHTGLLAQSGGDCHIANFGTYSSGAITLFDINDFDETAIAPFEWDLKRLATSLVLAAREADADPAALASGAVEAYGAEIARIARLDPLAAWQRRIDVEQTIEAIRSHRMRKRARRLLDPNEGGQPGHNLIDGDRLRDHPPLVFHIPDQEAEVRDAFARYVADSAPERQLLLGRYRLRDIAFKVVGVGSVGTFCAIGLFMTPDDEALILQLKEAQPSVLAPYVANSETTGHANRVVTGQRIMQAQSDPFLGVTAMPDGRQLYVRQLKNQRLAAIATDLQSADLPGYGSLCGRALARAHARSADAVTIAGYLGRSHAFARALARFADRYADQTETDWRTFDNAIKTARLVAASHA
jgi:uncharacterized protein (DUF2252 family)